MFLGQLIALNETSKSIQSISNREAFSLVLLFPIILYSTQPTLNQQKLFHQSLDLLCLTKNILKSIKFKAAIAMNLTLALQQRIYFYPKVKMDATK
jgi:hypothetical protein